MILGLLVIGKIIFIRDIRGTRDSRACKDVRGISNISYTMDSMPTTLTVLFGILRKLLGMCAIRILGLLGLARYKG